jgi:hypothetical protein
MPSRRYLMERERWIESPRENGNIPTFLSTTTLETYLQCSTIGPRSVCHGATNSAIDEQRAFFSFLLFRAK